MNTRLPEQGFSLTELMLVVTVIAVIAAIAVPVFSDPRVRRLQAATSEVTMALRFARDESVRTGNPHGVRKIDGENSVSVFRMDMAEDPPVEIHDVLHPADTGRLYQINLETYRRTLATTVTAHFAIYDVPVAQEAISFNSRGEPVDGVTGKPLWRPTGGFLLTNGSHGATVSVSRLAGRVSHGAVGWPHYSSCDRILMGHAFGSNKCQGGFSYLEMLVATVIIVASLSPVIESLQSTRLAAEVRGTETELHYRVLGRMEDVLSEPFSALLGAAASAGSAENASSYSDPITKKDRVAVYLSFYDVADTDSDSNFFTIADPNTDADDNPYTGTDVGIDLAWVRVAIPGTQHTIETLRKL